jgi:transcriptional regulator with XRE-family HTH domain
VVKQIKRVKGRTLVPMPSLRHVREDRGMTQRELAGLAGTTQPTIARIERGELATLQTLGKLMAALGVDRIEDLTSDPPEVRLAKLAAEDDSEGIEERFVGRFVLGDEGYDPHFMADVAKKKLREFRDAGSTDEAFLSLAVELIQLGKDRARQLAEGRN